MAWLRSPRCALSVPKLPRKMRGLRLSRSGGTLGGIRGAGIMGTPSRNALPLSLLALMRLGFSITLLVLAVVGVGYCAESFGPPRIFASAVEGSATGGEAKPLAPPPPASPVSNPANPSQRQRHQRLQQKATMLKYTTDHYDGVIVDEASLKLHDSVDEFKALLATSLEAWRSDGKKGVWLKVPAHRTELVPVSIDLGFELHHAEKAYIMLNMWLPPTENQLPGNASHQVGVGAVVLNDDGDMLVVREKNGPLRGTGIWKLPTGLIDAGEDLPNAAAREVLEETGVETEFDSVLAFRHGHRGLFGKSDLFFVVRMQLKPGFDPYALRPQESEIEECMWMSRKQFAKQTAESGTVLLREITKVMEAHLASEQLGEAADAGADAGTGEWRRASAPANGGGVGGEEGREDGACRRAKRRRHAAAFTARMLESSRKYGGKSMLYHGKL